MVRIVCGLTSIPPRHCLLKRCFDSLVAQSPRQFDHIQLTVEQSTVTPELETLCAQYEIRLHTVVVDHGPITKLIGLLETEQDEDTTLLVLVDDDCAYHPSVAATLESCGTRFGCAGFAGRLPSTLRYVESPASATVEFLETFAGVVYPRTVFPREADAFVAWATSLMSDVPDARYTDDIVIGAWVHMAGVRAHLVDGANTYGVHSDRRVQHDPKDTPQLSTGGNLSWRNRSVHTALRAQGYFGETAFVCQDGDLVVRYTRIGQGRPFHGTYGNGRLDLIDSAPISVHPFGLRGGTLCAAGAPSLVHAFCLQGRLQPRALLSLSASLNSGSVEAIGVVVDGEQLGELSSSNTRLDRPYTLAPRVWHTLSFEISKSEDKVKSAHGHSLWWFRVVKNNHIGNKYHADADDTSKFEGQPNAYQILSSHEKPSLASLLWSPSISREELSLYGGDAFYRQVDNVVCLPVSENIAVRLFPDRKFHDEFTAIVFHVSDTRVRLRVERIDGNTGWGQSLHAVLYDCFRQLRIDIGASRSSEMYVDIDFVNESKHLSELRSIPADMPVQLRRSDQVAHTGRVSPFSLEDDRIQSNVGNFCVDNRLDAESIPFRFCSTFSSQKDTVSFANVRKTWRLMYPMAKFDFFDNAAQREFIVNNCTPDVLQAYDDLHPGAFRADLFRYCYLEKFGGVYYDIKISARTPMAHLIWPRTGVERCNIVLPCDADAYGAWNGWMAATPGHPVIRATIRTVVALVRHRNIPKGALKLTGPGLLGRVVRTYFQNRECVVAIAEGVVNLTDVDNALCADTNNRDLPCRFHDMNIIKPGIVYSSQSSIIETRNDVDFDLIMIACKNYRTFQGKEFNSQGHYSKAFRSRRVYRSRVAMVMMPSDFFSDEKILLQTMQTLRNIITRRIEQKKNAISDDFVESLDRWDELIIYVDHKDEFQRLCLEYAELFQHINVRIHINEAFVDKKNRKACFSETFLESMLFQTRPLVVFSALDNASYEQFYRYMFRYAIPVVLLVPTLGNSFSIDTGVETWKKCLIAAAHPMNV